MVATLFLHAEQEMWVSSNQWQRAGTQTVMTPQKRQHMAAAMLIGMRAPSGQSLALFF